MPEDPDAPSSRTIEVRFAVVPAVARNKQPDPVFVFAGGPGQAATKVARQVMPVLAELNARRDLVFIDQRGTGRSNALACDVDESSLASALEPEQQLARLGPCLKATARGLASVRDLDRSARLRSDPRTAGRRKNESVGCVIRHARRARIHAAVPGARANRRARWRSSTRHGAAGVVRARCRRRAEIARRHVRARRALPHALSRFRPARFRHC